MIGLIRQYTWVFFNFSFLEKRETENPHCPSHSNLKAFESFSTAASAFEFYSPVLIHSKIGVSVFLFTTSRISALSNLIRQWSEYVFGVSFTTWSGDV